MQNKFLKFSEKELVKILNRGHLSHQDFLALREAMERKGMKGMIMCVGNGADGAEEPIKAAKEYIDYHKKVSQKITKKEIVQLKKDLLSPKIPVEKKKVAIVSLAHVATPEVFAVLKKYHTRPDKELQVWSELALQECRSFLKSELFEENTVNIGSLGGTKGEKIRFYFIFKTIDEEKVSAAAVKLMDKVLLQGADFFGGEIEKIKYGDNHLLVSVFLPFDVPPSDFAQGVISIGNRDGFLWHGDFYVNNTHLPSKKEINSFITKTVDFLKLA
jgi:hypothetical protein